MIAKSQDVLVALSLAVLSRDQAERIAYGRLGEILCMSSSEAFKATQRLVRSSLVEPSGWRPLSGPLWEYLVYGVPHAFPGRIGEPTRGLPTAWAAEPIAAFMPQGSDLPPVWPWSEGKVRGHTVEPLFPSVPGAIKNLPSLYAPLALVDSLRVGRARDREIAQRMLKEFLNHDTPVAR
jgi:hypothetical protein